MTTGHLICSLLLGLLSAMHAWWLGLALSGIVVIYAVVSNLALLAFAAVMLFADAQPRARAREALRALAGAVGAHRPASPHRE